MNNSIFFMKLNTPILSWYGIHDRSINLAIRLICYERARDNVYFIDKVKTKLYAKNSMYDMSRRIESEIMQCA